MSAQQKKNLQSGIESFVNWLDERFSDAAVHDLGKDINRQCYRWNVDFGAGKAAFRVAATERVLESEALLAERIQELERGTWLEDVEEEDNWVVLTSVGIAANHPEEW